MKTKKELIAYCAGVFDGEGSVTVHNGCIRLSVGMTDLEPLRELQRAFGGKIYGPRKGTNAPMYFWQIPGWEAVERIYGKIAKFLCARRLRQFKAAFAKPRAKPRALVKRPKPCGFNRNRISNAGHVAHYKRGEKACLDCYYAAKRYMERRRRNAR